MKTRREIADAIAKLIHGAPFEEAIAALVGMTILACEQAGEDPLEAAAKLAMVATDFQNGAGKIQRYRDARTVLNKHIDYLIEKQLRQN